MATYLNKVFLIGNVGRRPEFLQSRYGEFVVFTLATHNSWFDKNTNSWNRNTEWHRIVCYNDRGVQIARNLDVGSYAFIDGSIRMRKYQDKATGQSRSSYEVVADTIQILIRPIRPEGMYNQYDSNGNFAPNAMGNTIASPYPFMQGFEAQNFVDNAQHYPYNNLSQHPNQATLIPQQGMLSNWRAAPRNVNDNINDGADAPLYPSIPITNIQGVQHMASYPTSAQPHYPQMQGSSSQAKGINQYPKAHNINHYQQEQGNKAFANGHVLNPFTQSHIDNSKYEHHSQYVGNSQVQNNNVAKDNNRTTNYGNQTTATKQLNSSQANAAYISESGIPTWMNEQNEKIMQEERIAAPNNMQVAANNSFASSQQVTAAFAVPTSNHSSAAMVVPKTKFEGAFGKNPPTPLELENEEHSDTQIDSEDLPF